MGRIMKIEPTAVNERKLRVAAYARVSTGNEDQLLSLETQKLHYESFIKRHKEWEYAGLYYDEGISGTHMAKRDGLLKLLSDCERGLIDYILVKSISRFSRNVVECMETVRRLSAAGIFIFFEKENIDTRNMESELLLSILSSLAESESRSISENVSWGVQKRFQNGTFKIGYPPYGYENVNGQMVVNKEHATVVRQIYESILSGLSAHEIAARLNDVGIPSKRNGKWSSTVISGIIRNEKYIGDVAFQKTYTDSEFIRRRNNGERTQYYMKDHHEPIVDRDTYEKANAILRRNGLEKGNAADTSKYNNRYVFSGRIICGKCSSKWKRKNLNGRLGYSCSGHIEDKEKCDMLSIYDDAIRAAFVTMMNKLIFAKNAVLIPMRNAPETDSDKMRIRLDDIDFELAEIAKRKSQILRFFTNGFLDPAVYENESTDLTEKERHLNGERRCISSCLTCGNEKGKALDALIASVSRRKPLTEFDDALFLQHVDHIIVYTRKEIGFSLKCGPVFRERLE